MSLFLKKMTYPSKYVLILISKENQNKFKGKDMSIMRIPQIFRKYKNSLINAIGKLKGSDKRISLAIIAKDIGRGGQSFCF